MIFVDTGAFLGKYFTRDQNHRRAVRGWKSLAESRQPWFTSNFVLDEFFTLLGPPHTGKSAVLRAIAGFVPLSRGRVIVDGEDISAIPARERGIGYVFHEGALWPHLSVRDHVAFGLEQQGMRSPEILK